MVGGSRLHRDELRSLSYARSSPQPADPALAFLRNCPGKLYVHVAEVAGLRRRRFLNPVRCCVPCD